jgi:tRNA(Ile)-lysidine synthase
MDGTGGLLARCAFPAPGTAVELAVSGGADSVALALLAVEHGLRARLHHVDHHLREDSGRDAELVATLAEDLGCAFVLHEVDVAPGGNLEARARAARRRVLPAGAMTGHSMDDLAETMLINLLRGAGLDGLSPMVGEPTKPLLALRRAELAALVRERGRPHASDATNLDTSLLRNLVRLETLPMLDAVARRDLVPVLARQAGLLADERAWLDELTAPDRTLALEAADCRELAGWPVARLRRWLRGHLRTEDAGDGAHPPSAGDIERALAVVRGEAVATELAGARRLARRGQRLRLEKIDPLRSSQ